MPSACFSPARSPRKADKSQLPSQRSLGRQTPGGVTPALVWHRRLPGGPVESPSPLLSQGLCSSFPEWLLDEVMRLGAREEAAGKRCWPGPSSPGTRLPGLRALPAQRLPNRGPRGPGGEQDSGPNARQPRSGAPGDPGRLSTRPLVSLWLGPGPGLGLRSHADPGVPAPGRVATQGPREGTLCPAQSRS